jgi:hypothetical protein
VSIKFAAHVYRILRSIPLVLFSPSSTVTSDWPTEQPCPIRTKEAERLWSRIRMRALRRDHSRCRGCDTKGDEITLYIHLIEPGAHDLDSIVTLCVQCEHLANEMKLQSASIPDFLQQLWRYLHHPKQAMQNRVSGVAVASQPQQADVTAGLECIRTPYAV